MIDKHFDRLLREVWIHLGHLWADAPTYYMPDHSLKESEAVRAACDKIQRHQVLPWPSEYCLAASESWPEKNQLTVLCKSKTATRDFRVVHAYKNENGAIRLRNWDVGLSYDDVEAVDERWLVAIALGIYPDASGRDLERAIIVHRMAIALGVPVTLTD